MHKQEEKEDGKDEAPKETCPNCGETLAGTSHVRNSGRIIESWTCSRKIGWH